MKFDEDDSLAIHVALDNVIVISEISKFLNYSRIFITTSELQEICVLLPLVIFPSQTGNLCY